jgi:hypothetical protein
MADRSTAAIYVAANGRDAVIYAYERDCLDVAHSLAWLVGGAGVIHVYDDDNDSWRWKSPTPHKGDD